MTYEYKCSKCKKVIEKEYPMDADHPDKITCSCGSVANRIFGASFVFPFYLKHDEEGFDYTKHKKTVF